MGSIDAKIAELLGWHIKPSEYTGHLALYNEKDSWVGDLEQSMISLTLPEVLERVDGYGGTIPHYSTDLDAAWQLGCTVLLFEMANAYGWDATTFATNICYAFVKNAQIVVKAEGLTSA